LDLYSLLLLAQNGAQETLSKGNEQTILAYVAVVLGGVVAAMALFIVKRETAHKTELVKLGQEHAGQLKKQAETDAEALKAVNDELHKERDDRRKQEAVYLKEVIETAQAMSRSLDENTRMGERLANLIERGQGNHQP
jgi:flagellar motility protein MotE (MotC chaperone)